jgi:hypothetical protein
VKFVIQGKPLSGLADTFLMQFPVIKQWSATGIIAGVAFMSPQKTVISFVAGVNSSQKLVELSSQMPFAQLTADHEEIVIVFPLELPEA